MSAYNVKTTDLSSDCLFPNTAAALIKQAKVFTGMEIVADPHWRAAPSLWLEANGKDDYREMLSEVQKSVNSPYGGFVSQRAGMGAYIVYADHNDRWDGSLSTAEKNNLRTDTLCHEIGHILTAFPEVQLTPPESRYFCEQSAILAGTMLKTAVGNKGITYRCFPLLKEFQPAHIQQSMVYDAFCIYTPSPIARYYESNRGHNDGVGRYLSSSGVIRFDNVADDVASAALHFRLHLSAMEIFGTIAKRLSCDPEFAGKVSQSIPGHKNILATIRHYPKDLYATTILKDWWKAVRASVERQGMDVPYNMYAGEDAKIPSIDHARGYFLTLALSVREALSQRPQDFLLQTVSRGLDRAMMRPGVCPKIISKVSARYAEGPQPRPASRHYGDHRWQQKGGPS